MVTDREGMKKGCPASLAADGTAGRAGGGLENIDLINNAGGLRQAAGRRRWRGADGGRGP